MKRPGRPPANRVRNLELPPERGDALELRVSLLHTDPEIWRTVRVPADLPLAYLHDVLQAAFGWEDCHLHQFLLGDLVFARVGSDVDVPGLVIDEAGVPLGAIARKGTKLLYHYDFGDDWEHELVVTSVTADAGPFTCLGGERAAPPEDSGGPFGYAQLLETLADPKAEDHAEMKRWAGRGFDAAKFDRAGVNKRLATLWKRITRAAHR